MLIGAVMAQTKHNLGKRFTGDGDQCDWAKLNKPLMIGFAGVRCSAVGFDHRLPVLIVHHARPTGRFVRFRAGQLLARLIQRRQRPIGQVSSLPVYSQNCSYLYIPQHTGNNHDE